jgi:hypothetical protein
MIHSSVFPKGSRFINHWEPQAVSDPKGWKSVDERRMSVDDIYVFLFCYLRDSAGQ